MAPGGGKRTAKKEKKPSRPQKIKRVKEVVWNEDSRKDFLTGFSKRKKQRENAVRTKAIEREKEELRESRKAIRDERKERAALNVKNAKALYGDAEGSDDDDDSNSNSDDDDDEDEEEDSDADAAGQDTEYTSTDLITTVHVEEFRLSRSPSPLPLPEPSSTTTTSETLVKKVVKTADQLEKHKKRVRNKPASRPKMSKQDKKDRATGGKRKKEGFLAGNKGTKARSAR